MNKIREETILGVNIAVTNMDEVVSYIKNNIKKIKGEYICVSNVHTTVMSHDDLGYMKVQNDALLRLPDGRPLSLVQKKRGYSDAKRVTGPDLMLELFNDKKLKHYFYGSSEETLNKLCVNLEKEYPDIKIVGMYSPPFRTLTVEEDKKIVKQINDSKPDIVWVGLGAPKQENWMHEHKNIINGLMIGVGAGFDYHAGNIKRAPKWMQNCSLEWLYRLMQNPKKLFKRYMSTNFKFIKLVSKENKRWKRKKF